MQVKTYAAFVLIVSLTLTAWLLAKFPDRNIEEALRASFFQVISAVTSTGFVSENYETWGDFGMLVILLLIPVGACCGSTSGGVKMFRFDILFLSSLHYLRSKILPHGVFVPKYNDKPVNDDVVSGVIVFMSIFFASFLLSALALAAMGIDLITALSAAASAIGNTGLGLGKVGPTGSFAALPAAAKWILSVDMMLGRLEFMTVFVLLLPLAWRREKKKSTDSTF